MLVRMLVVMLVTVFMRMVVMMVMAMLVRMAIVMYVCAFLLLTVNQHADMRAENSAFRYCFAADRNARNPQGIQFLQKSVRIRQKFQ